MTGKSGAETGPLDDTIEAIYAASLDETLWHGVLGRISTLFGGVGSILVRARSSGRLELTWIQEHVPVVEGRWDHYRAYAGLDVRTAHGLRQPALAVYTDYEFIDEREIDHHPFYQEFMAAYGLRYTVGSRFPAAAGEVGIVNVFRNKQQGHHGRREVDLMTALLPHLTRACAIDQRLAQALRAEARLREALDCVPDAIFLLEPDGRIVDANRAAEQLLRARHGLAALQGRLCASHNATRQALADAVAATARRRVDLGTACALPIPRPSDGRPLQALLMPMPRAAQQTSALGPAASPVVMLVVSDPDRPPMPLAERLAVLWGLTPAEGRLAAALAGGASVQSYAGAAGIRESTARWTLKRLLAKCDCRRQSEMIRMLSTAASSWQASPHMGG